MCIRDRVHYGRIEQTFLPHRWRPSSVIRITVTAKAVLWLTGEEPHQLFESFRNKRLFYAAIVDHGLIARRAVNQISTNYFSDCLCILHVVSESTSVPVHPFLAAVVTIELFVYSGTSINRVSICLRTN